MNRPQTDHGARRRLLDAQRAETHALRAVVAADRKLATVQSRVQPVDDELAEAQAVLVSISGLPRAAQLLELDERVLRQRVKQAERADTGAAATSAE